VQGREPPTTDSQLAKRPLRLHKTIKQAHKISNAAAKCPSGPSPPRHQQQQQQQEGGVSWSPAIHECEALSELKACKECYEKEANAGLPALHISCRVHKKHFGADYDAPDGFHQPLEAARDTIACLEQALRDAELRVLEICSKRDALAAQHKAVQQELAAAKRECLRLDQENRVWERKHAELEQRLGKGATRRRKPDREGVSLVAPDATHWVIRGAGVWVPLTGIRLEKTKISRQFTDGWWQGTVMDYEYGSWRIQYDDGDEEVVSSDDLMDIIVDGTRDLHSLFSRMVIPRGVWSNARWTHALSLLRNDLRQGQGETGPADEGSAGSVAPPPSNSNRSNGSNPGGRAAGRNRRKKPDNDVAAGGKDGKPKGPAQPSAAKPSRRSLSPSASPSPPPAPAPAVSEMINGHSSPSAAHGGGTTSQVDMTEAALSALKQLGGDALVEGSLHWLPITQCFQAKAKTEASGDGVRHFAPSGVADVESTCSRALAWLRGDNGTTATAAPAPAPTQKMARDKEAARMPGMPAEVKWSRKQQAYRVPYIDNDTQAPRLRAFTLQRYGTVQEAFAKAEAFHAKHIDRYRAYASLRDKPDGQAVAANGQPAVDGGEKNKQGGDAVMSETFDAIMSGGDGALAAQNGNNKRKRSERLSASPSRQAPLKKAAGRPPSPSPSDPLPQSRKDGQNNGRR